MASEADPELWDIDIDQNTAAAAAEVSWTLDVFHWDPVNLTATRKPAAVASARQAFCRDSGNDSGASNQNCEAGMEVDPQHEGGPVDPNLLASAPVYLPQPPGCKMMVCQVAGCGLSLEGMKGYFLRHRVCEEHSKAPVLIIGDVPSRLCQQCSKFHHVSAFEGSKRTCRVQLDRIRVNKRIRRNRKMNAAAAAAHAATAGLQDDDGYTGGEEPAPPAALVGLRSKRPADSSGSGEGSWADSSRKSRHMGGGHRGTTPRACGNARVPAAVGSVGIEAGAAAAMVPMHGSEQDVLLPESGGSDTGSHEHPRASVGVSGIARWQAGVTNSSVPPLSPAQAGGVSGGSLPDMGGSGSEVQARSPVSAFTGGCGSQGAPSGADNASGLQSSFSNAQLQQQMQVKRLGSVNNSSLPAACVDMGGPGSIAAAAAAAGLLPQHSLTTALTSPPAPALGMSPAQDVAHEVAAGVPHLGPAAAYRAAATGPGLRPAGMAVPALAPGRGQEVVGLACTAATQQDPQSAWMTSRAVDWVPEVLAAEQAVTHGLRKASEGAPGLGAGACAEPNMPSTLHPLLQQQLQQELFLQQRQKIKAGALAGQLQGQQQPHQQQQGPWQGIVSSDPVAGLRVGQVDVRDIVGSGLNEAALSGTQQQQTHGHMLPHHLTAAQQQQQQQQQPFGAVASEAATAAAKARVSMSSLTQQQQQQQQQTLPHLSAGAEAAMAGSIQAAANPDCLAAATARPALPDDQAPRASTGAALGASAVGVDAVRSGGGGHVSTGTNTLTSSKLLRMSLENDDVLDDGGGLLGNLMDLLQTQAADPRDTSGSGPRPSWLFAAGAAAPSTFSGPGSHGSGNGSLTTAAVASNLAAGSTTNILGAGGLTAVAGGLAGADISSNAALSRAGSGALGSPQTAVLAAVAGLQAPSLDALAVGGDLSGVGGMPAALHALNGRGAHTNLAAGMGAGLGTGMGPTGGLGLGMNMGLGTTIGSSMAGSLASRGVLEGQQGTLLSGHQMGSANDILLQQQLLLAQQQQQQLQQLQLLQQQQQQQQQLLQLQQAHAQAKAQAQAQVGCLPGGTGAAPAVPAAGLLLSRLLDADSKTHHLSTELNGCLAEKQLLRRQLLATLSCHGPDPDQVAVAAMAAAATSTAGTAAALPGVQPPLPGLGPQLASLPVPIPMRGDALGGLGSGSLTAATRLGGNALGFTQANFGGTGLGGAGLGLAAGGQIGATDLGAGVGLGGAVLPAMGLAGGAAGGLAAPGSMMGGGLGGGGLGAPGLGLGLGHMSLASAGLGPAQQAQLGGFDAGGLLASARPAAAAQLQALAEARAAAAAGGIMPGSGGGGGITASGPVGSAGGGASYVASDVLTRVSLKFKNRLPDDLPQDIRSHLQWFTNNAPLDVVQGCLRPGCTELVLDALHAGDEQQLVWQLLRAGDTAAAAAALLDALPSSLRDTDIYLQAADQALCLTQGAPPRRACWAGVGVWRGGTKVPKPELVAAESLVLHLGAAGVDRTVRFRVFGRHLTDPGVTFLARLGGLALAVTITPADSAATAVEASDESSSPLPTRDDSEDPAKSIPAPAAARPTDAIPGAAGMPFFPSPPPSEPVTPSPSPPPGGCSSSAEPNQTSYDLYDVEVLVPYNAPPQGLLILEPRVGVLLGSWAPVLLLEQLGAAAEAEGLLRGLDADHARRLAVSLGLFVDHAERCAAYVDAQEAAREAEAGLVEEVLDEEDEEGEDGCGMCDSAPQADRGSAGSSMECSSGHTGGVASPKTEAGEEEKQGPSPPVGLPPLPPPRWSEVFGAAHERLVGVGRTLLAYSALRGCPKLLSYVGSQLVEMGDSLSSLVTACRYGGCDLLACATLSGCIPALCIAGEWVARAGVAVDWRAQVPGQPLGATLLHVAAGSLPLPTAISALEALWALAIAPAGDQPAHGDAFAAAWFADDGGVFDPPSLLFRAVVSSAAAAAAAAGCGVPGAAGLASSVLAAAAVSEQLDRLCLARLAESYIRMHNCMSPLDNVELPSMEANSVAALSAGSGAGDGGDRDRDMPPSDRSSASAPPPQRSRRLAAATERDASMDAVAAAAADREVEGLGAVEAEDNEAEQVEVEDLDDGTSYLRSRTRSAFLLSVAADAAAEQAPPRSGAVSAAASGRQDPSAAGRPAPAIAQVAAAALLLEQPMVAASPPRIRVAMAPKALAQTAAAAAAAASGGTGHSSWFGSGSGADASLLPPSATTVATNTTLLYGSGSMPAFASGLTAYEGSSYSQLTAAQLAAGAKGSGGLPMAPLLNMSRPLPGSPSSPADTAPLVSSTLQDGELLSSQLQQVQEEGQESERTGCRGDLAEAPARHTGAGASSSAAEQAATHGVHGLDEGAAKPSLAACAGVAGASRQGVAACIPAPARGPGEEAAEAVVETLCASASVEGDAEQAGQESSRQGHMRGLARMFKRLFKKGSPAVEALDQQ